MAHRCWICGAVCRCKGDIDDMVSGEKIACLHYRTCDADAEDDNDDEEADDGDE